jgi:CO/xanthine dehydrogenase Mo-binding subunit
MAQGNMTALVQILAGELGVSTDVVDIVMGDTQLCPWDPGTFGSMSIAVFGPVFRRAAAEARTVLRQLAAGRLHVPEHRLQTNEGVFIDRERPSLSVSYGELANGRAIVRHLSTPPVLGDPAASPVVGQCVPRRDAMEKVTGRATYAADVRLPSMLYAALLRPPSHGARLIRVDTVKAASHPGAILVHDGDVVAALHVHPDQAQAARDQIVAEWSASDSPLDDRSIYEHLIAAAPNGQTVAERGNSADAFSRADARFEATYLNAYVAHAPMETHAALAAFDED